MMNARDRRIFCRRLIASSFRKYHKIGMDLGTYGHYTGPVATPKLQETLARFIEEAQAREGRKGNAL